MTVTLSPIYAHFSETLTGLNTIRALRETERFSRENEAKLEVNQQASFCGKNCQIRHIVYEPAVQPINPYRCFAVPTRTQFSRRLKHGE